MRRNDLATACLLALFGAGRLFAQDDASTRYVPPSGSFACMLPGPGWKAFEEDEYGGPAVHILGPAEPHGVYRAGIDVRFMERGQPGFLPMAKALDRMRRSDKAASRGATGINHLRAAGVLARLFEVTENRRLPLDALPSSGQMIHSYVAVLPNGDSYWVIRLSSTRDTYLDYRETFQSFLKSFRPSGY